MFILNLSINPPGGYTTQQLYGGGQFVPSPFSDSAAPMGYNGNGVDFASQNPFWSSNSLGVQNSLSSMGLFPRRSSMSIDDMVGIMTGRSNLPGFNNLNTAGSLDSMLSLMDGGTSTSFIQPSSPSMLDVARLFMDGPPAISGSMMLDASRSLMDAPMTFPGPIMLNTARNMMDGRSATFNSFSPVDILRSVMYTGGTSGISRNLATSRVASQFFPVIEAVSTGSILNSPLSTA